MRCTFCGNDNVYAILDKKNTYWRCNNCEGVFLDSKCFLSPIEQKKRYNLHNNDCTDNGYTTFLKSFIQPVLKNIHKPLLRILDYGCGPCNQSGISNLNKVIYECEKTDKQIISENTELVEWDPFFANDVEVLKFPADLVCCLEVAEHFENPEKDFTGLAKSCKEGGIVAIGTMLVPKTDEDFKKWWYKNDSTHVSFYSLKSLKECGKKTGLSFIGSVTPRCFLFKKIKQSDV